MNTDEDEDGGGLAGAARLMKMQQSLGFCLRPYSSRAARKLLHYRK
jgi:hypothetical protein